MKIKAAAIKYRLKDDPGVDRFTWGHAHSYCRHWFLFAEVYPSMRIPEHEEEGFLTDTGEFVDREQAYLIAREAGQLKHECADGRLISENVVFPAD